MNRYVTGSMIRQLRERKHLTQGELAQRLYVSGKTVSKWETGQGLPDISLLEPLAKALDVSLIELFSGQSIINRNRTFDLLKAVCYVCPVCGNMILSTGQAVVSCCGITLPPLLAEEAIDYADEEHTISLSVLDGEYYVSLDHPMEKQHYITCLLALSDNGCQAVRLYPEGAAEAYFRMDRVRKICAYCNLHGMFCLTIPTQNKKEQAT